MIPRFIEALRASVEYVTDEDVADILWLATQISAARTDVTRHTLSPENDGRAAEPTRDTVVEAEPPTQELGQQPPAANLYPAPAGDDPGTGSAGGMWFRSPGATALPGALALGRALRPFKRRVGSRTRSQLDEAATARNIAEEGIWRPSLRPVPSRWLDVALVVDGSRSMDIWLQTARELQQLLEHLGAFRDVRVWTLTGSDEVVLGGALALQSGLGSLAARRTQRDPMELIDAGQRRLILVLSDCVATAWRDGRILRILARWGQTCPVTLIQTLPQRMWTRTILRYGQRVRMRAPVPGAPNARLRCDGLDELDVNGAGLLLPVATLDARSIGNWARALTARHGAWTIGYALAYPQNASAEADVPRAVSVTPTRLVTPEERLRRFRSTASPEARELVALLAAAPVSLPVISLIQRTLLPELQQYHVAEVLLSGLFEERRSSRVVRDPARIHYEFRPGVRELLIHTLPKSQTLRVLTTISAYVSAHAGVGFDFPALLADSTSSVGIALNDVSRPFAAISALALRGFGGSYAALADRLRAAAATPLIESPAPPNWVATSFPPSQKQAATPPSRKSPLSHGGISSKATGTSGPSHAATPAFQPRPMTVFISSTSKDLLPFRRVVIDKLRALGHEVLAMEDVPARPVNGRVSSLEQVGDAHVFIGLIGWRYGTILPGDKLSITEQEYHYAVERGIPALMFLGTEKLRECVGKEDVDDAPDLVARFRDTILKQHVKADFDCDTEALLQAVLRELEEQDSESDDPLTRISLDELHRLIERKALIATKRLSKVTVPPPARPAMLRINVIDSQFFDCTLNQVRFAEGSRFITTSFIKCRMGGVSACITNFFDCWFDRTNLDGADFRESDFTRALFTSVLFNERTHFLKANFTYAKLQEVRGSYVTFTQANMYTVEISNGLLTDCKFDRAELTGARLWRSDFHGSDFSGASLREADVDGASFRNCKLEGANFEGARNIDRADFRGSTWRQARFDPIVFEALKVRYGVVEAIGRVGSETREEEQATEVMRLIDVAPSERSEDETTRKLRLRRMVTRLRRARSVNGVCRSFTACVEELTKSGYNNVFLLDRNGEKHGRLMLRVRAEYIDSHKYTSAHRYDVASMDGVIGRALKARQAILVDDVRDDADYIMVESMTRSELALPILHPELHTALGVVNIEHQEVAAFPVSIMEDLQSLVAVLAGQLVRLIDMGSQSTS